MLLPSQSDFLRNRTRDTRNCLAEVWHTCEVQGVELRLLHEENVQLRRELSALVSEVANLRRRCGVLEGGGRNNPIIIDDEEGGGDEEILL
jgi:hypothetical protein